MELRNSLRLYENLASAIARNNASSDLPLDWWGYFYRAVFTMKSSFVTRRAHTSNEVTDLIANQSLVTLPSYITLCCARSYDSRNGCLTHIRATLAPKRQGCVKCGHFLQEFCAGAQEYDVLFTEALVIRRRCAARSSRAEDSLASVTPGSPRFSRSLRKLLDRFN